MSPSRRPSPDSQNMLYSSHLRGMERPVRSFKSFIRATPPRASLDKPLPPVPAKPSLQKNQSSSSITTVQTRSTGLSLWEAPSNWDNGESSQAQSTPPFALRHYSLLIPEPPEDIAAMQADPVLWQQCQSNGSFQQTQLDPINERTTITPDIPPRNPSRLSLSLSSPATTRKNSKDTLPSISARDSTNIHEAEPTQEHLAGANLPSPLDLASALSDMMMKEKAFKSLCLGSPHDQGVIWGDSHQRTGSVQLEDGSLLDLHGNKLTMFRKGSVLANDSPISPETAEMDDKMQALSFSQDYHNVLADQYVDGHDETVQGAAPRIPSNDRDLTPQPLAWQKPGGSPPAEACERPQLPTISSPGRHKKTRKMSTWINRRLKKDSQTGVNQRSASDPEVRSHGQLPESEVDQHLKHDTQLSNIVQHGRNLVSRRVLCRESEPRKPMVISLPLPQQSEPVPKESSVSTAPFELATPVLRLPGGLSIVRQSPVSSPRPLTASDSRSSLFSDLSWPDLPVSSPFQRDFLRRNSWQSTASQPQMTPLTAIKRKFSSPLGSPSTLRSFSYSTTSLTTPATQGSASPYNPPQQRRRSHNIGSPLTAPPSSYGVEQHTEEAVEGVTSKLNLFEKAKNARDTWKKHQKNVKNKKLKQSIRLVGPADATDVAGYIQCAVDGRQSEDSGIGQMGKETS